MDDCWWLHALVYWLECVFSHSVMIIYIHIDEQYWYHHGFPDCCAPSAGTSTAYLSHHVVPPGSSEQALFLHPSLILHGVKAAENHVHVWRAETLHHIFYTFPWITPVFMCESGFSATSEFIKAVTSVRLCNAFCAAAETTSGSAVICCLVLSLFTWGLFV